MRATPKDMQGTEPGSRTADTASRMVGTIRLGSSLRIRPAQQTIDLAEPHLARFGISRVTQITRMDRLGLPVFASVRPRGKVLRVHAGKGVAVADAMAGAVMEAVEFAVVEPDATPWQAVLTSVAELAQQLPGDVQFVDFAPRYGLRFAPQDKVVALACCDIGDNPERGRATLLPAQLVFMPYFPEQGPNLFGTSSNGLASGNTVDEATLHGLFEILERDACAMNRAADASCWLDPASLPEPFFSLSHQWAVTGVELMVRFLPNQLDLPCFQAMLYEAASDTVRFSTGYGLHLDPAIALSRAICEAAQSRLSVIHGGREDITQFYEKYHGVDRHARKGYEADQLQRFADPKRTVRFEQIAAAPLVADVAADASIGAHLASLLTRLSQAGFGHVYRHVFEADLPELAVVKVIVPKCEHVGHGLRRIGPRLMQRILAHG